jgi:uncharacterized RDD family membrane protein YckC
MTARTNTLLIRTPEGITFSLLLAGPLTRFLAWIIDIACIIAAAKIVLSLTIALIPVSLDLALALSILLPFVIQVGYGMALEWYWRGQTVGKRLLRLRVMDAQGLKLQFSQVAVRNLLRVVDSLPLFYLVGGVAALLNRHAQRLGDLAANTVVIRSPRSSEPNIDQITGGKYNSLRNHPHLEARLRQRVSPDQAAVALQALVRRDELEPSARVELFRELADHFRAMVEFPPEAIEGVTDEQYVRNVVDVLFRTRPASRAGEPAIP